MIEFVPMTAEHAMGLIDLEAVHSGYEMTPETALDLEAVGGTTAIVNGSVVAIAGVLPQWRGVGLAWAWLGRGWRAEAKAITNRIRAELAASPFHRIEAAVKVDYDRGHRWLQSLGFVIETPLARKWGPDGADYSIYVKIRSSHD